VTPDLAASLRQRLLNIAKERKQEFEYVLARYACERFLYRLGQSSYRNDFVLKGATLFGLWTDLPYRATRDVDLLGTVAPDVTTVKVALEAVCAVECAEDGVRFDTVDIVVSPIRAESDEVGLRAKIRAFLGTARMSVQVDIGFGDVVSPGAVEATHPVLLPMPAPRLKVYPKEAVVAEKLAAMIELGIKNSRMKDFFDIAVMAREFKFDGATLRNAVAATLAKRRLLGDTEYPVALTASFYEDTGLARRWGHFLASGELSSTVAPRFTDAGAQIRLFVAPVYESVVRNEGFARSWRAAGPWQ